jgi:multiple sugar transport system ATP-binding protein
VIKGIDLDVKDGEFVIFVGPSGCGKSTLLRIIAGLEDATSGNDAPSTTPGSHQRAAGEARHRHGVPVLRALSAHLTVQATIWALGLKQAGTPKAEIDKRVAASSAMLSLEPYLKPVVRPNSPVASASASPSAAPSCANRSSSCSTSRCRTSMRRYASTRASRSPGCTTELKATMIYVTHDQVEAMTLADQASSCSTLAASSRSAAPMELYNKPANLFVAGFIGSPKMNFIEGARLGETVKTVGVRPEHISVSQTEGAWKGTVVHAEHLGADTNVFLETEKAGLITIRLFGEYQTGPGATLYATPEPARTYRFGEDGKVLG